MPGRWSTTDWIRLEVPHDPTSILYRFALALILATGLPAAPAGEGRNGAGTVCSGCAFTFRRRWQLQRRFTMLNPSAPAEVADETSIEVWTTPEVCCVSSW